MNKNSFSVHCVAEAIQLLAEQSSKIVAEAQDVQQSDLMGHAWLAAHDLLQHRTKPDAAVYVSMMPSYLRRVIGEISATGSDEGSLPIDPDLIQPSLNAPFEDEVLARDVRKVVTRTLLKLTPREDRCIRLRFGIGHHVELYRKQYGPNAEHDEGGVNSSIVASEFNVTTTRITAIEHKALRKLKHPSRRLRRCLEPTAGLERERQSQPGVNRFAEFEHTTIQVSHDMTTRPGESPPFHTRSPYVALGVYLGPIAPREMPKPPTAPEAVDMREMFSLFTTAGLATAGQFTFPEN